MAPPLVDSHRGESRLFLKRKCSRFLNFHTPATMKERLKQLSELAPETLPDQFGDGDIIERLETTVGGLLGKRSAVFVPSGIVAQLVALRTWSQRKANSKLVLHSQSHLITDEEMAFEMIGGMTGCRRGRPNTALDVSDLRPDDTDASVLLIELPLRRAGFVLPSWKDLLSLVEWARERGVAVHVDGARLWEAASAYRREPSELATLADSIYVSLYKGLGGLAGSVLAGDENFVRDSKPWLKRYGARINQTYPFVIAALSGIDKRLAGIAEYTHFAGELFGALRGVEGITLFPDPPQVNAFQIHVMRPAEEVIKVADRIAAHERIWLFDSLLPSLHDHHCFFDAQIGDGAVQIGIPAIVNLVRRLRSEP